MSTFLHDSSLPSLPLPELRDTCAAIPDLVAPLTDPLTFEATCKALEAFCRPDGPGERLQNSLKRRKGNLPGAASWLRPLWDDMYTRLRLPLPENVNYFFRLADERWGDNALPRFVRGVAAVLAELGAQTLEPEQNKAGYLSMDQARSAVYTRIPVTHNDMIRLVPLCGPQHVAVSCQGRWFVLQLIDDTGELAAEQSLAEVFEAIREEAALLPPAPPVAAFTAMERDHAAKLRGELLHNQTNRLSLNLIERAIFTVDLAPPLPLDETAPWLLGGERASRWFDKSLQIIASQSGGIGASFEHAGCDAAIWLYLLGKADAQAVRAAEKSEAPRQNPAAPVWRPLEWDLSPELIQKLEQAHSAFRTRTGGMEFICRGFPELSREKLKACNTSPDSFLQLSFQAALYQLLGKAGSTYEAVSVRGFYQGRTDCARPGSGEALAFARALASGKEAEQVLPLYRQAEQCHLARLKRCQQALGAERHIYGLAAEWRMRGKSLGLEKEPGLFTDPGWLALKHDALSTSSVASPFISFFGFGPTTPEGLGIGYTPRSEATGLVISSFHNGAFGAAAFAKAFERSSLALRSMLLQSGG